MIAFRLFEIDKYEKKGFECSFYDKKCGLIISSLGLCCILWVNECNCTKYNM